MMRRVAAAAVTAAAILLAAPGLANASFRAEQWHLDYLNVSEANAIAEGDGVIVAVIDTGVEGGQPDLAGSLVPGTNETGAGNADGSSDIDGHGTAMAGIIAGHGDVRGIAPKAKIMPISAFTDNLAVDGIDFAIDHGANIINVSQKIAPSSGLKAAVQRALDAGLVVVAGAGNRETSVIYPAAYDGVIAVGAIGRTGARTAISATGPQVVLAAPGEDIVTTGIPSGLHTGSGTSDSTAVVSGVAALLKSKYPSMTGREIYHRLTVTADDAGPPGRDNEYGYGIVNPVKALTADVPPLAETAGPTPDTSATEALPGPTDDGTDFPLALVVIGLIAVVGFVVVVGGIITAVVIASRRRTP